MITIKNDENLSRLSERVSKEIAEVEKILCEQLPTICIPKSGKIKNSLIYTSAISIVYLFRRLGLNDVKSSDVELLENCIIN